MLALLAGVGGRVASSVQAATVGTFDEGYRRWRSSSAHAALLGDGLPAGVEPFSFVPIEGMELLARLSAVRPDQVLVDLGCGRGGPGLWLASRTGADLIGIDSSAVAIGDAVQRREAFPDVRSARFEVADAASTGLPDRCADAVVSIDVLQLVDEPDGLLAEAARLLTSSGRLVLTTWEGREAAPPRFPRDLAGLFERSGLRATMVTEQPAWLERQLGIYESAATLAAAGGDSAVADMAREGRRWQRWWRDVRRALVVAERGH